MSRITDCKNAIAKLMDEGKIDITATKKNVLMIDLCYPRQGDDRPTTIEVGLSEVRAADSVQISYDFSRDGWSIKQASTFGWDYDDTKMDADWREVAFVQAWARKKDDEA